MASVRDGGDPRIRQRLRVALSLLVWVGLAFMAVPFIASVRRGDTPDRPAPMSVRLDALSPGEATRVMWEGRPVWVLHRSPAQMTELSRMAVTPASARPAPYVAFYGYVDGCPLVYHGSQDPPPDVGAWSGGFWNPCAGTGYDASGRRVVGHGAETLARPLYRVVGTQRLEIGAGS